MNVFKNRTARALILIMCALVLSGIAIASIYYKKQNKSVDPRIAGARILYEKYNRFAQQNAFDSIFNLMDSVEKIYSSCEHYRNSYETGVLYNNRAASYLTMALYSYAALNDHTIQDSLINLAETATNLSIEIYTNWMAKFQDTDPGSIKEIIYAEFIRGLENFPADQQEIYLKKRIKEIQEAQTETNRRLSVSYTNLGVIYRQRSQYKEAAYSYKKALDLWDRNLTAENNLNKLLGRPLKKRNLIQKLFPPDRN